MKITFELLNYENSNDLRVDGVGASVNDSKVSNLIQGDETILNDDNANNTHVSLSSNTEQESSSSSLVDSYLYVDLVTTHKNEMDILFGAYSRSTMEEKRLLSINNEQ